MRGREEDEMMNKETNLRVWHIPQVPMKPFYWYVDTPEEAIKIIDLLGLYDDFQFVNNIKPDYSNVSGLEVLEDGEWCEWYSDDGDDIREYADLLEEA
jgi:hypothetical protein